MNRASHAGDPIPEYVINPKTVAAANLSTSDLNAVVDIDREDGCERWVRAMPAETVS